MANKVQKSVGSETSREHRPRCLQHSTSYNSSEISYYSLLMEAARPENHTPIYIPPFQHRCFSFLIDINLGWLHKSMTHPYQHIYWNILLLDFHYHSTKNNYQYNYKRLLNFIEILIFTNTVVWTFCFLFVNIIIKLFTYVLVWFATVFFCPFLATIRLFITTFWMT